MVSGSHRRGRSLHTNPSLQVGKLRLKIGRKTQDIRESLVRITPSGEECSLCGSSEEVTFENKCPKKPPGEGGGGNSRQKVSQRPGVRGGGCAKAPGKGTTGAGDRAV